jgi:AcrR family transcriptional regulator
MEEQQSGARVVRGRNRIQTGETDGPDVRDHIRRVALELFIEEGYDKTSLREIAEKLGVTKAALYYHFPTKDDIVNSLIEQRIAAVDELIAWAEGQPRTTDMRLEFIRRYAQLHHQLAHDNVIRFFERNQTLVNTLKAGTKMREQMTRVFEFLTDPQEPLAQQLRRAMALFSIHASSFLLRERPGTQEEKREAALEVARELMTSADEVAVLHSLGSDVLTGLLTVDGQDEPQAEELDARDG